MAIALLLVPSRGCVASYPGSVEEPGYEASGCARAKNTMQSL